MAVVVFVFAVTLKWTYAALPSGYRPGPAIAWALLLASSFLLVVLWMWYWKRTPIGFMVTSRNVASLSAFQVIAWTILFASLIIAIAFWNPGGLEGQQVETDDGPLTPFNPLGNLGLQIGAAGGTAAVTTTLLSKKKRKTSFDIHKVEQVAKARVAADSHKQINILANQVRGESDPNDPFVATFVKNRLKPLADQLEGSQTQQSKTALDASAMKRVVEAVRWLNQPNADTSTEEFLGALMDGKVPDKWDDLHNALKVPKLTPEDFRHALKRFLQAQVLHELTTRRKGIVYQNRRPCEARWTDILEGDEIMDHEHKMATKIQFFLFTIAGLAAFILVAWHTFKDLQYAAVYLPNIPRGLTEILAFSGAGYLGAKAPNTVD